jgi:hypothetical protein
MQDLKIHRLLLPSPAPIVMSMKKDLYRYPTSAELYALELAARRERAREMARLVRAGASAVKSLVTRLITVPGGKGRVKHA